MAKIIILSDRIMNSKIGKIISALLRGVVTWILLLGSIETIECIYLNTNLLRTSIKNKMEYLVIFGVLAATPKLWAILTHKLRRFFGKFYY